MSKPILYKMNNTITKQDLQEYNFCFWFKSDKFKVQKYIFFAESKEKAETLGFQKLIEKGIDKDDLFRTNTQLVSRGSTAKYTEQRKALCIEIGQATLRAVDSSENFEIWNQSA